MRRAGALLGLAALAIAGCTTSSTDARTTRQAGAPDAGPSTAGATTQTSSLDAILARTHVAFVADADRLSSANERWRASIERGVLRLAAADAPGEIAVRTESIARDGWACAGGHRAELRPDGSVARRACADVEEQIVPAEPGVAIQWRFERAPSGQGDLVVRLAVDADRVESDGAGGARTSGRGGELAISRATWIDATGARTPVPLEVRAGSLVARVPDAVLRRSAYPALLDPTLGPAYRVDVPHLVTQGTGATPSVSWNGSTFLVVFDETVSTSNRYVRAFRIDPSGAVLDEFGIDVGRTVSASFPHVAWTGTHWVISWLEQSSGWNLRAARVAPDGTLIDRTPVPLGSMASRSSEFEGVELAMVGSTLFAVWLEDQVQLLRLDPSTLTALDAAPILLGERFLIDVRLASDGTRALVTWRGPAGLRAQAVAEDGTGGPISTVLAGVSIERGMDTAWIGGNVAIGYRRTGGGIEIVRAAPDGTPLDATPIAVAAAPSRSIVRLAARGSLLDAAVWTTDAAGERVLSRFTIDLGAATPTVSGPTEIGRNELGYTETAIGAGGALELAVWGGRSVTAARVDAAGTVLDVPPIGLNRGASQQYVPALAWSGTHHVLAWRDTRTDAPGIYVVRVGADGAPIDALGVLAASGGTSSARPHLLAGGGAVHLVVNEIDPLDGAYYLRARTIGSDLSLGPVHTLDLGATATSYAIAASPTSIRVAFLLGTPHTRAFGFDHAPIGPAVPIANGSSAVPYAIGASGTQWSLASLIDRPSGNDELVITRLRDDGTAIGSTTVDSSVYSFRNVGLAGDPGGALALWERSIGGQTIARVRNDGTVAFSFAPSVAMEAPLGLHGGMHLMEIDSGIDGYLAFVRLDGTIRPRFELELASYAEQVAASSDDSGHTLVAYRVWDFDSPYRNGRVKVRLLTPDGAMGSPCSTGTTCESGLCVDGVCCDATCGGGSATDCVACAVAAGAAVDGTCAPLAAGVECRAARSGCDRAEVCDGSGSACPADALAPSGTPCPDALACNGTEVCSGGACVAGAPPSCDLGDVCTAYACIEPGGCTGTPIAGCCRNDGECDDLDPCTVDACLARACSHSIAPACTDAGPPDAGPPDAGPPDAGPPDAGPPDAGPPDGGPPDAGIDAGAEIDAGALGEDAGSVALDGGADAGLAIDGGATDAGLTTDAGPRDAAAPIDAAIAWDAAAAGDAALPIDGAIGADAGAPPTSTGCGCRVAGDDRSAAPSVLAGLLAIAVVVARRSRASSRPAARERRTRREEERTWSRPRP